ncbi:UPF0676 protein [Penicillium sp. CMV-2018d]|nr:UPF0676 protein [Penicillium sp. CMV-2018d]
MALEGIMNDAKERDLIPAGRSSTLLTGEHFKYTVHRVVTPSQDEWDHNRIGLVYCTRLHDETILRSNAPGERGGA